MIGKYQHKMPLLSHSKKTTLLCLAFICLGIYFISKADVDISATFCKGGDKGGSGGPLIPDAGIQDAGIQDVVTGILEEIQQRIKMKAVGHLLGEKTSADDPRLVKAIRNHFIEPPSKKLIKMSMGLIVTPQAKAVDDYLKQKVGDFSV